MHWSYDLDMTAIQKTNLRAGILLTILLGALIWGITFDPTPDFAKRVQRCAAIENKLKSGSSVSYKESKYRTENCTLYSR